MSKENEQVDPSAEVFNRELLEAIQDSPDGILKQASTASSNMIRRKIRENGFARSIIPPKPVGNEDLDRLPDTDLPVIIEDMEPLSPGAKSISFDDTADTAFYKGDKFVVYFDQITTPEFTKNINELRTYKMDLRAVITDNSLKDMQRTEDSRFIKAVDRIVGSTSGVGLSGVQQNFEIEGTITRDTYQETLSILENMDLNNGVFLMNRKTAKSFLGWNRTEIGGDLSQELFTDGLNALKEAKIHGVRHLFTIKRDLVPDNVVYLFTEPDYLGRWYSLQDTTMYVEKKKDILRFSAKETLGVAIANVAGVAKVTFVPA
jgi:hypothetical protein